MKALAPRLVLAALAATCVLAAPAAADSNKAILKDDVTPSLPTDDPIFGVPPGGAPWVIDKGEARVKPDGRVRARVEGLVIPTPPQNGTNPIPLLRASVYCDGVLAGMTASFPFSPGGDARIEDEVSLPGDCRHAAVLLNPVRLGPTGQPAPLNAYIGSAGVVGDQDDDD
jgi:hypothetical protein